MIDAVAGLDRARSSVPSTESCFSRCAIVFASPMSFAATISKSPPCWSWARRKFLPMRPKPLIPTLVFAISEHLSSSVAIESNRAGYGTKSVALRSLARLSRGGGRTGKLRGRPSRSLTRSRPDDRRGLNPPPDEQEPAEGEYDSCDVAALGDLQRITSVTYEAESSCKRRSRR